MAKELSKSGILTGADILAGHVTQSVDALTGIEAYDITISGSLEVTGSVLIDGLASNAQSNVLTYNTSSGQLYYTASSAIGGGGGGPTPNLQQVTTQGNTTTNDIKITGSLYQSGSLAYFQSGEFAVDALGDTVFSVGQSSTQNIKIGIPTTSTEVRSPLTASIISASGDIQALSFTGVAGTTNNLTSSYAITASHALNGGSGSPAFPFTGSALITGSLGVTGSISNIQGNNKITLIDGVIDVSTPTNHLYIGTGGELTQSYSSGQDNVAIGLRAGFTSLTDPGAKNTFIGNTAGQYNTNTPQSNIGIGHSALANIQGDNNIGIGVSGVLGNGVSGGNNIGIGRASLYGIASGEHNISIGDGIAAFNGMDYQLKIGDGSIIAISASLQTGDIIFPSTASAQYFAGDGSQLTNLPSTTISTASYTSIWSLGAVGTDHYTITGPGLTGAENDPDIYLTRGEVYKFNNDNSGGAHPFQIQTIGGSAYGDGVTNNGGAGGTSIEIDVQFDAPTKLFYQCTSHANMRGIIYIADAINHSGSFSGSFQGDGSQLTGIEAGTNLTQSIFVTQNGDDTTGTIGNMSKPFATLESASQAATTGSTIFVYPGTYTVEANYNLAKPGLDYYFYPNTTVSKSTAGDMFDLTAFPTSEVGFNVFGYGDFILGSSAGSLLNSSTGVTFDYTFQARDIQSNSSTAIVDNFTNTDFTANWEFRNMSGSNSTGFNQSSNNTNGILNLTCDSIITKDACINTGNGYRVANVKAKLLKSTNNFAVLWYGSAINSVSGLNLIVDEAIGVGGDNSDLAYRFTSNNEIDIVGQTTGIQFGINGGGNAFNGVCNHLGRCIHLGVEGLGVSGVYNGSHVSKVDMGGDGTININWVITPNATSDYIKQSSGKALVNILGYQNYSNLIQITGGTFIGDGCFYTKFPTQNIEVSGGTFIWKGKYDAYVGSTNYGSIAKNRRVIYQTGGTVKIQGTISLDGANFTSNLPANIITYNGGKLILDGATLTTVDNAQPAPAIYLDQDRDVHIFSGGINYNQTGSNALLAASGSGFELTNPLGGMIIEDSSVE